MAHNVRVHPVRAVGVGAKHAFALEAKLPRRAARLRLSARRRGRRRLRRGLVHVRVSEYAHIGRGDGDAYGSRFGRVALTAFA
eukprot:3955112-Prymnesium_polylepis.2